MAVETTNCKICESQYETELTRLREVEKWAREAADLLANTKFNASIYFKGLVTQAKTLGLLEEPK